MGIVFGDIGTSPLYALKEAAKAASLGGAVSPAAVLGIVSLIFWSLIVVISIKYAILIMRADNHGEGGILALLALISPRRARQSRRRAIMVTVGIGWGRLALRRRRHYARHFSAQRDRRYQGRRSTVSHSRCPANGRDPGLVVHHPAYGYLLDRRHIRAGHACLVPGDRSAWARRNCEGTGHPRRFSPLPAINFMWSAGPLAFAVIGAAFLAVTGGEALYADMGHFGPFPIRLAWFGSHFRRLR